MGSGKKMIQNEFKKWSTFPWNVDEATETPLNFKWSNKLYQQQILPIYVARRNVAQIYKSFRLGWSWKTVFTALEPTTPGCYLMHISENYQTESGFMW